MSIEEQDNGNSREQMEIVVEPWKKLRLSTNCWNTSLKIWQACRNPVVQQGGTAIPTISGGEGVAFLISPFPDESEVIIEEKLKGIIHYNTVLFALKPSFEAEIFMRGSHIRINLIDVGTNEIFESASANSKVARKDSSGRSSNFRRNVPVTSGITIGYPCAKR